MRLLTYYLCHLFFKNCEMLTSLVTSFPVGEEDGISIAVILLKKRN